WDQWLLPYPHDELPILCFNALELDFSHNPHPLMHYVGPMVLETRQESKVEPSAAATLENIFTRCRNAERQIIYCSCSTFLKSDQRFLQRLIAAVSDCSNWELILGLGGQLNVEELSALPDNVHAFAWVPQLKVLQQVDCAINNGGINSINECLYFGVPMLVYSLNRFDQNGDAARVAHHGLGIAGDMAHDSPEQIRDYIKFLLGDQRYQTRVKVMQECYHRYGYENRAVQVVDSLLSQLKPPALAADISLGGVLS
ncbi:MAG: nucleotide disphospho-sugar-binding domain-containing protein, partial [Cyanobacteria bacterium P01_D01_bin.56]